MQIYQLPYLTLQQIFHVTIVRKFLSTQYALGQFFVFLFVLAVSLGTSGAAHAQIDCESGQADATCRLTLIPGVTLESPVAAFIEVSSNEYQINGDIQVVTAGVSIPLNRAAITVKLGESPEVYGETDVPLDQMPLLENAVFHTIPRAVIGFANGSTLPDLVGAS